MRRSTRARRYAERLVAEAGGNIKAAGELYDERFGMRPGTGARLIHRLLAGQQGTVKPETVDRLWVLL